ncbi:S26 family signal peptidase [Streptomyces canarius]
MTPTYGPGDRIFYERTDGSEVRRGDVVLLSAPAGTASTRSWSSASSAWAATGWPAAPGRGRPRASP